MLKQVYPIEVRAADILTREQVAAVSMERDGKALSAEFSQDYHRVDLFLPEKLPTGFLSIVRDFAPQVLLVNPPRAGLTEAVWKVISESALSGFTGPIIYSSCNAATMARDLGYLALEGYRVERMRLFDFFPWTHHFETVALLVRQPSAR
jgi:tRNA/tmRNA/rRNA uracil-C5-methylase (TrmA/RlmC/RlmD family)